MWNHTRCLLLLGALLSGCGLISDSAKVIPPMNAPDGCPSLPAIVLNKFDYNLAGIQLAQFTTGQLRLQATPELASVLSESANNQEIVNMMVCKAQKSGAILSDKSDLARTQANYIISLSMLMNSQKVKNQLTS